MNGKFGFWRLLVGCLLVSSFLTSVSFSQAQPFDTWAGAFSFTVKSTSQELDNSGNQKFLTSNQPFAGTLSLFLGDNTLVKNGDCYLTFSGSDGTTICITEIAVLSTESQKSKNEKALLVGVGTFATTVEGTPVSGIAYVDLKGTLKEDKSDNLASIALNGKIGGGANEGDDNFVFSGTLNNTTLTKQAGSPD